MTRPKLPADGFIIANGPSGFVLLVQQAEFGEHTESGTVPMTVVEEIRMSPLVARQLLQALSANLGQYEEMFGKIQEMPDFSGRSN